MLDTLNSQYDSFLFWKLPIPELDLSELECLGLEDTKLCQAKTSAGKHEEDVPSQYNEFNFWRAPIASIEAFDFDFI